MKKTNFFIMLFAAFSLMLISCDDKDTTNGEYVLSDEEQKELDRQDSLLNAQKNQINADLVLEYDCKIVISSNLYTGTMLDIELDKIAGLFDITTEQLLAGIAGEDASAPEVKGFAIEWSTRKDYGEASNTNAPWGHWWDANGDVTTWGETAMVFAEFDYETGKFHVGQYPAHLVVGQTINFIECLKYNDKRVAVVVKVLAGEAEEVVASVVDTQELEVTTIPNNTFEQTPVQFNLAKVLSDLGISSMDEVQFLGVKEDGGYSQEAVTGKGFWYDMNGNVGSYGEEASVFTAYGDLEGDDIIGIGQMPNNMQAGMSVTVKYGFLANNKIVILKIKVNIVGYEDPEEKPAGDPKTVEFDVPLTKAYDNTYSKVEYDVQDILKDAFKMTTYEIFKAKNDGSLKVYLNEVTEEDPSYTADAPGYWMSAEGVAGPYADGVIWLTLGASETSLYLYGGNHPVNCSTDGQTVATKFIITCNGGKAIFNVTYEITKSESAE